MSHWRRYEFCIFIFFLWALLFLMLVTPLCNVSREIIQLPLCPLPPRLTCTTKVPPKNTRAVPSLPYESAHELFWK
jgi:hypothetical protein